MQCQVKVVVPPGNYFLNSTLIKHPMVSIIGAGRNLTNFYFGDTINNDPKDSTRFLFDFDINNAGQPITYRPTYRKAFCLYCPAKVYRYIEGNMVVFVDAASSLRGFKLHSRGNAVGLMMKGFANNHIIDDVHILGWSNETFHPSHSSVGVARVAQMVQSAPVRNIYCDYGSALKENGGNTDGECRIFGEHLQYGIYGDMGINERIWNPNMGDCMNGIYVESSRCLRISGLQMNSLNPGQENLDTAVVVSGDGFLVNDCLVSDCYRAFLGRGRGRISNFLASFVVPNNSTYIPMFEAVDINWKASGVRGEGGRLAGYGVGGDDYGTMESVTFMNCMVI